MKNKHDINITSGSKNEETTETLYRGFDRICDTLKTHKDCSLAENAMTNIVGTILTMLDCEIAVSEDLLVLTAIYCNKFDVENKDRLKNLLKDLANRCLNASFDSDVKVRSYQYFQQYLLTSNLLLVETQNEENKNKELLYDIVAKSVNEAMIGQQKHIRDNAEQCKDENKQDWQELMIFDQIIEKEFEFLKLDNLRQDLMPNGVKKRYKEAELWNISMSIENNSFDCFQEFNTKNYLTNLLIASHSLNGTFQQTIKQVFNDIDPTALYQSAPVKLEQRCIIKVESLYCLQSHLNIIATK